MERKDRAGQKSASLGTGKVNDQVRSLGLNQ